MELKAGQIVTVDWCKEPDDPVQAIPDLRWCCVVLQVAVVTQWFNRCICQVTRVPTGLQSR